MATSRKKIRVQQTLQRIVIPIMLFTISGLDSACARSLEATVTPTSPPQPTLAPTSTAARSSEPALTASPGRTLTITGVFTTIWNGGPHYSITDDAGQRYDVLLDEKVAKPFGGPLALDRKRFTIIGESTTNSPNIIRVLSIRMP